MQESPLRSLPMYYNTLAEKNQVVSRFFLEKPPPCPNGGGNDRPEQANESSAPRVEVRSKRRHGCLLRLHQQVSVRDNILGSLILLQLSLVVDTKAFGHTDQTILQQGDIP